MSVQSKIQSFAEVGIIFGLMVVFLFQFEVMDNEMDVLPYARAFFDPDWLRSDWYLHLKIPYRFLFSYPAGWSVDTFGWVPTIVFGRLLTYLFITLSLVDLRKTVLPNAPLPISILPIALFLLLFRTGIGPGEWIVGALDTKVFAYGFAILSLSRAIRGQWVASMSAAGLALSFHLLVGGYNAACIGLIGLYRFQDLTSSPKRMMQWVLAFLLTGSVGLFAIADHLFFSSPNGSNEAWTFYVENRVAHHLIPSEFSMTWWILMPLFTVLNLWVFAQSKNSTLKQLSLYGLGTTAFAALGFLIWLFGPTDVLRYYFFRISDALLPLCSLLVVALVLRERYPIVDKNGLVGISLIVAIIGIPASIQFVNRSIWNSKEFYYQKCTDVEMAQWIKRNTSSAGVFLTNFNHKFWYIHYERPLFAGFKNAPQNAHDLEEWMHRLTLINGGINVMEQDMDVSENFTLMSLEEYVDIKRRYPEITYLLLPEDKLIDLPVLYRTKKFILYDLATPKLVKN